MSDDDALGNLPSLFSAGAQATHPDGGKPHQFGAFDYASFAPEQTKDLRAKAERIRAVLQKSVLQIGLELAEAKKLLQHGDWGRWLSQEVSFSATTATNYMRAAIWITKSAIVAELPAGALFDGSGAPEEVQEEIANRLGQGETLSREQIREAIRSYKERTAEEARLAAMEPAQRKRVSTMKANKHARQEEEREALKEEMKQSASGRRLASQQLVKTLKQHLSYSEIVDLVRLWQEADVGEIRKILDAMNSRSESGDV